MRINLTSVLVHDQEQLTTMIAGPRLEQDRVAGKQMTRIDGGREIGIENDIAQRAACHLGVYGDDPAVLERVVQGIEAVDGIVTAACGLRGR